MLLSTTYCNSSQHNRFFIPVEIRVSSGRCPRGQSIYLRHLFRNLAVVHLRQTQMETTNTPKVIVGHDWQQAYVYFLPILHNLNFDAEYFLYHKLVYHLTSGKGRGGAQSSDYPAPQASVRGRRFAIHSHQVHSSKLPIKQQSLKFCIIQSLIKNCYHTNVIKISNRKFRSYPAWHRKQKCYLFKLLMHHQLKQLEFIYVQEIQVLTILWYSVSIYKIKQQ